MNSKGYTIPELLVVIVVVGIMSFFLINKASYAYENPEDVSEKTEELILTKSATIYSEKNKDMIKNEKTKYISANDLEEAGYLVDANEYKNIKIKLDYVEETDQIEVSIIK